MKDTDTIQMDCWITFDRKGINKMYKNKPALYAGEKSMKLVLSVPKAVFQEPDLIANVSLIGDPPQEHYSEIVADVKEALASIPHVHITVPDANPQDPN